MVVQVDKRLLWHPRCDNKFVVGGGTQLTLYEWVPESLEIKQITSQLDLSLMKCFAWSSDSTLDDLVAVGLTTGRVDLMRLEATKYARDHVVSSGPCVSLPTRNSRSCNALAFSPDEPNYLAVGLDKVRSDSSLMIWDIHSALPVLSLNSATPSAQTPPIVRSRSPLPKGDVPPRADQRIAQQYASAEAVSSVTFLPHSPKLLLAGVSHRWLRLFDLRAPFAQPVSVASKVQAIAVDPVEPFRIGCYGEGVATIWDTRHITQPLLTFTEKDATADGARPRANSAFAMMEFSSTRRGMLATLERDSSHVRFWDLQQADVIELYTTPSGRSRDSSQSARVTRSWTNPSSMLPWSGPSAASGSSPVARTASDSQREPYHLVLSDTHRTKQFSKPLSSFALVPRARSHPLTSDILVVNKDGDLELYAVHNTPKSTPWSARGDLGLGVGCSYRIIPGFREGGPPPEPWDLLMQPSAPASEAHSMDRSVPRDEPPLRGRSGSKQTPAFFGRGDEDGFPALPAKIVTNLAATRPLRSRTFSPAALRNLHFEHHSIAKVDVRAPTKHLAVPLEHETFSINDIGRRVGRSASRRARDTSTTKSSSGATIEYVVEDDISMVMRERVVQGYGLANALHNSIVARDTTDNPTLAQLWLWIDHAQRMLCEPTSRLEGFNFAYQGLSGIWDGLRVPTGPSAQPTPRMHLRSIHDTPTLAMASLTPERATRSESRRGGRRHSRQPTAPVPEDFMLAIDALNERYAKSEQSAWRPAASTNRLSQRRLALQLCGWSLAPDDLTLAIRRWEKEGRHSQAACWLVFTDQHKTAVDVLMRSKDESHHMMSGLLAAFAPSSNKSARNPELVAQCERLIVRLQDPYLRAMLTYLAVRDWSEVLQEDALPLRERLAIALQFLDDRDLSSYLRQMADRCGHDGDIEGLIVTGLTPSGMDILQSYVDITGDVQSATILACLSPSTVLDVRTLKWLDAYRDIFDGWKLFHHRSQFDIDRGRILQDAIQHGDLPAFEWAPRQILIRCNYCSKPMEQLPRETDRPKPTACPHCGRPLPRCSICLMTLTFNQDPSHTTHAGRDTIDDALVFCQTCRHGGHASHILPWFYDEDNNRSHGTCPVAGCDCRCADEF